MLGVTMKQHTLPGRRRRCLQPLPGTLIFLVMAATAAVQAGAQTAGSAPQPESATTRPVTITIDEAIRRAEANEPNYAAAVAGSRASALDRSIARAGLMPSVVYHNQLIYTQPNGTYSQPEQNASPQPQPVFVANDGIREYFSQAIISETVGLGSVATVRRADAASALAAANMEISRRGLVAAVTSLFYGLAAADHKLAIAKRAQAEAADFTKLTTEREQAREAAHADVVKAELQQQQRERDFSDARLAAERARLELGVLLFPDPRTPYDIAIADAVAPLASRAEVDQAAARNNPELKSAFAAVDISNADVLAARAAYLPNLGLNFNYGIDAPHVAANGPDGVRYLGYSATVTVDIPVWDWLSTEHKVKQSEIRRDAARVTLSATQKRLIARLDEAFAEAQASRDQLVSLDQSVATAAESLRLTRLRYTGGDATVLEVVDAQNAFVLTENAREDGRVRYQMALADLQTLTGTM
jgi:outer membrane protein TolC